jgi:hypothetical protein
MFLKSLLFSTVFTFFGYQLYAQASGDAGIGTIGNFDETYHDSASAKKYEADLLFNYATANGGLSYYQPQVNLRKFNKNGSFLELRLPVSIINQSSTNTTTSGMGDILVTYNGNLAIKNKQIKFSLGTRISFSNSFLGNDSTTFSEPMAQQPGLGTIDLLAAANYDLNPYLSAAVGIQVPVINYNKNIGQGLNQNGTPGGFIVNDFHRQPDVMLKLIGHYGPAKFKLNGGLTGIIHLGDDYYSASTGATYFEGNYYLRNSLGIYLNANLSLNYIINKRVIIGLFYSQSLVSPDTNSGGLARNWIISPKVTYAF